VKEKVMSKMIFVNLPVRDLAASTAFYVALGGKVNPQFSGEQSTSLMFLDSIGVMLLTHDHYRQFTQRPIGDARHESHASLGTPAAMTFVAVERRRLKRFSEAVKPRTSDGSAEVSDPSAPSSYSE